MQVNHVSFCGVIPVKVYNENGIRDYSEHTARLACRKITEVLAGPVDSNHLDFVKEVAKYDKSYSLKDGLRGYCRKYRDFSTGKMKNTTPSDYFKIVFDNKSNPYILTGFEALRVGELGKQLGLEKMRCREARVNTSKNLVELKRYYSSTLRSIIENKSKRMENNAVIGVSLGENKKVSQMFIMQG